MLRFSFRRLRPVTTVTSFHHQPEAQHPKSSAIHKNAGRLPHLLGVKRTSRGRALMSASLIGRLGSSAFRFSITAVSMSLAGSCFSTDSALGPFHHGIRGQGGTIF